MFLTSYARLLVLQREISFGKHVAFRPMIVQKGKGTFLWVPQRISQKGKPRHTTMALWRGPGQGI